ncbi:MAG: hypothetical protein PF517_20115 [Salinivirgaceae bacterium]|jgi:hypothetical protein|nr:hypothetical protein [Salinivirgaceae bacterium]
MSNLADIYGLNRRIILEQIGENHIAIIKRIKSRIIQKDAQKIFDISRCYSQGK